MANAERSTAIEAQIDLWRGYLRRRQGIQPVDVAELEDHLREQVDTLVAAGLSTDEAFLVAVKRMGELDALSREFAREHSERLWKQLVVIPLDGGVAQRLARTDAMVAIACALAAALAVKAPTLFGKPMQARRDCPNPSICLRGPRRGLLGPASHIRNRGRVTRQPCYQRLRAASSSSLAATQSAPDAVISFFQKGALDFR